MIDRASANSKESENGQRIQVREKVEAFDAEMLEIR